MVDLWTIFRTVLPGRGRAGSNISLGPLGEKWARKFLRKCGYRHLQSNFFTAKGEVDLIMEDGRTIVFVEVKTRRSESFALGETAVNQRKQGRLQAAARRFIKKYRLYDRPYRFDVVVVTVSEKGKYVVRHHKHAFRAK